MSRSNCCPSRSLVSPPPHPSQFGFDNGLFGAGPKCNACEAGTSWSGSTDDQPCATVRSSCPAGYGYGPSTSAETDATCTACAAGTFSDKDSSDACAAHAVTSCPVRERTAVASQSCSQCLNR